MFGTQSLKESFVVKRLMPSRLADEAHNDIVATLRAQRHGTTECVPQNDSQSDELLGLVQQLPAETNGHIAVAEEAELNHKVALAESSAV